MTSMEHSAVGFDDPTLIDPLSAILNNLTQELEASDNHTIYLSHWISKLLRILGYIYSVYLIDTDKLAMFHYLPCCRM